MATETRRSGFMLGVLIGGAVGAVSSLLLAPKTGARMREDLSNRYRSVMDKTREWASAATDKTKDVASRVANRASDLMDQAEEGKQQMRDSMHTVKDAIQDRTREMAQDRLDSGTSREADRPASRPN